MISSGAWLPNYGEKLSQSTEWTLRWLSVTLLRDDAKRVWGGGGQHCASKFRRNWNVKELVKPIGASRNWVAQFRRCTVAANLRKDGYFMNGGEWRRATQANSEFFMAYL